MKKVFLLITVILFGLGLASCTKEDPAEAYLQTAYDSLNAIVSDPSNIKASFNVPTTLADGVTAEWTSSNPGVATVGAPSGGFSIITINRPAFGEANVKVTLTVELAIASELDAEEMLTKEWSIEITVIANEVEEITIETVADILAIDDEAYDGTYQVEIPDMTIIGRGQDAVFAFDGTGTIQIYGGLHETLEIGKVYTVSGTLQWYYGIWEIQDWTAVAQTSATAQFPEKEVITSVNDKIDELIANGDHEYTTVASGNFETIHATVTGKIYMIPGDTGNYNTYLVDTTFDAENPGIPGSDTAVGRGFMFYYNTFDLATVRLYNGLEVTIEVLIYTYRSNNKAFAVYYIGGPEGVEAANLSEQQKLDLDIAAISMPVGITEATTLDLPTEGANGTTIAWTSNSALINVETGAVTMPETDAVSVKLTAVYTQGTLPTVTKNYYITVGTPPTVTMAGHLELADGALAYTEVEIMWLASNGKSAVVADSTGFGYIYANFDMSTQVELGDFVGVSFTVDIYGGLYELTYVTFSEAEGEDPNIAHPEAVIWTAAEAEAFMLLEKWVPVYVTMTLTGYASGDYTNGILADFEPYIQTNGASSDLRDVQFTATGWVIGRSSSKITIIGDYVIVE
ncbi:MAG: immunoglobulin-like domain-containing protein [Acholeplasmataceae bacterium]|nr:OB-fold nucleic acid binding domain-containing protein [Acholeplasmataceae bacterium]